MSRKQVQKRAKKSVKNDLDFGRKTKKATTRRKVNKENKW